MNVHNVALVGADRMGALDARNVAGNARFRLSAIADHDPSLAEGLAEELGSSVASYDAILSDRTIGAVIVASSTNSHLENVLAAVKSGKAVFCEKPLSLDADTLAAALPEIEGAGRPVFVAFNRRFDPNLRDLKRQFEAGEIGSLESLHIINHDPAPPRPEFIPRSGGLFKDFTIHDFDTARWLMSEDVIEVFSTGSCLIDPEIEALGDIDTAKLVLRSRSGALCVISNSRRTGYGYDQRVELFGSAGALRVSNDCPLNVGKFTDAGERRPPIPFSFVERYADAYEAELNHFADVLDGKVLPSTGPRDSLRALRLADAAEISMRTGAPVRPFSEEID